MVILDYPNIGGKDIKYHVKKANTNLLHENIDFHSSRLIAEFPGDGVNVFPRFNIVVQT